jgi:hypothetical protein
MISFETVNRAAIAALPAILARLVPGGKIVAREYIVRNPTRADRHPGSFKINIRTGHWADFATGDKGGDPVSLVAYLERMRVWMRWRKRKATRMTSRKRPAKALPLMTSMPTCPCTPTSSRRPAKCGRLAASPRGFFRFRS